MEKKITKDQILKGLKNGTVKLVPANAPGTPGTACKIGEYDFWFGGEEAESTTPEEYMKNVPMEEIASEILSALDAFAEDPFDDNVTEYLYYAAILEESEKNGKTILLVDLPVTGYLRVQEFKTKKVFLSIGEGDPGDVPPDIAMRTVVNIYAENNWTVIEV